MRKQGFLFVTALAGGMFAAAPALAQDASDDLPFNGLYVGASVGYDTQPNDVGERIDFDRNLDGTFGDNVLTASGANAFSPTAAQPGAGFCNGAATSTGALTGCTNDKDDISYSGRIGYDRQFGHIVVGLVGEFGKSEIRDSVTAFSTTPASYTITREIGYTANVRARLGYALDNTLFYGTGGGLYARINNSFRTTNVANAFTGNGDKNAYGFTAGGGVEQKISKHFSIGVEYLFNRLQDSDYRVRVTQGTAPATNPFVLAPNTAGTDFARSYEKFRWHSVRATALFRF